MTHLLRLEYTLTGYRSINETPVAWVPDHLYGGLQPTLSPCFCVRLPLNRKFQIFLGWLAFGSSFLAAEAVGDGWVVRQVNGNARAYSEVALNTPAVRSHLDDVEREFASLTGLTERPDSVEIVIFRTVQGYRNYLRGNVGALGNRRAIFYRNGDVFQIYAIAHSQLTTDLRHEYTHALLHHNLPYVPLWVDEGIAEYLEIPRKERPSSQRLRAVRWKARTGWAPRLKSLERIASAEAMTSNDYRDSWAWVHYLASHSNKSRHYFKSFLDEIDSGAAPGDFSDFLARRDRGVAEGTGSYFRKMQFSLRSPLQQ